jgi:hypothetical protein
VVDLRNIYRPEDMAAQGLKVSDVRGQPYRATGLKQFRVLRQSV